MSLLRRLIRRLFPHRLPPREGRILTRWQTP